MQHESKNNGRAVKVPAIYITRRREVIAGRIVEEIKEKKKNKWVKGLMND